MATTTREKTTRATRCRICGQDVPIGAMALVRRRQFRGETRLSIAHVDCIREHGWLDLKGRRGVLKQASS
jgi:hypothetical protein